MLQIRVPRGDDPPGQSRLYQEHSEGVRVGLRSGRVLGLQPVLQIGPPRQRGIPERGVGHAGFAVKYTNLSRNLPYTWDHQVPGTRPHLLPEMSRPAVVHQPVADRPKPVHFSDQRVKGETCGGNQSERGGGDSRSGLPNPRHRDHRHREEHVQHVADDVVGIGRRSTSRVNIKKQRSREVVLVEQRYNSSGKESDGQPEHVGLSKQLTCAQSVVVGSKQRPPRETAAIVRTTLAVRRLRLRFRRRWSWVRSKRRTGDRTLPKR